MRKLSAALALSASAVLALPTAARGDFGDPVLVATSGSWSAPESHLTWAQTFQVLQAGVPTTLNLSGDVNVGYPYEADTLMAIYDTSSPATATSANLLFQSTDVSDCSLGYGHECWQFSNAPVLEPGHTYTWIFYGVEVEGWAPALGESENTVNGQGYYFNGSSWIPTIRPNIGFDLHGLPPDLTCTPPPSGMVGWWPGDGNADDIRGSSPGALGNGVTFSAGRVDQAFVLNGPNQFVYVGNSPDLWVSNGEFTLDLWVKFTWLNNVPPGVPGVMVLADKMNGVSTNDGWRLYKLADNRFAFCLGGRTAERCGDPAYTVFSATTASLPYWFHVAVVKTSVDFRIYLDGVLEDSRTLPNAPPFLDSNSRGLYFGATAQQSQSVYGRMDELSLFNRALTDDEILAAFHAGPKGRCKVPPNTAPGCVGLSANPIVENDLATLSGAFSDPDVSDTHDITIDWGDGTTPTSLSLAAGVLGFSTSHRYLDDNPTATAFDVYLISAFVTDSAGASVSCGTSVRVNNAAPAVASVTGPSSPVALGGSATVSANFTDVGSLDMHVCQFNWDDGSPNTMVSAAGTGNGSCSANHTYAAAGVYDPTVTVTDDDTGSVTASLGYIVIYDPSSGFVTGGGWYTSPVGAYLAHPDQTGKATFGLVAKYPKSGNLPTGETEFHFSDLNFHSSSYDWLVINGARGQYQGSGTVNNAGNYGFIVTVIDGQASGGGGTDKIRMKIWDKNNGNAIVYDNQMGAPDSANPTTPIGGGSIVLHR